MPADRGARRGLGDAACHPALGEPVDDLPGSRREPGQRLFPKEQSAMTGQGQVTFAGRDLRPGAAVGAEVLFLDEPTVGLDTRIRHDLFDTIAALRERTGVTVLLTTHYLDEAERLCDRLALIDGGRIVAR